MKKVDHEELEGLIRTAYEKEIPLFIWGATGIGKSDTVRKVAHEIAEEKNLKFSEQENLENGRFGFVDVRISQLDPSDLRGLPKLEGEETSWKPPSWLPRGGQGILFFDEINLAPPSIQASAYQLILDRRLGEYRLPDGWVIISAGNRLKDRANIYELPAPLANRFVHIELNIPSVSDWTEWALKHDVDSRIIAFLENKKSYIFKFDPNSKDKAFPTPRAWFFCSKLIEDKDTEEDLDEIEILASSAVGEGAGIEFSSFLKLQDKVDLKEILRNPEKIEEIEDVDLKYFTVSGLADEYGERKKVLPQILEVTSHMRPEFAILLLMLCKRKHLKSFKKAMLESEKGKKLLNRYGKYLI